MDVLSLHRHRAILGVTYFGIAASQDRHVSASYTEQSTISIYCLNRCVEEGGSCAVWVKIDHVEASQGIAASLVHEHDGVTGVNGGRGVGRGSY